MSNISDTCNTMVRRSTGHANTSFTNTTHNEKCGRPTRWKLQSADGAETYGWSCDRHRGELERVNPGKGFRIVGV